MLKWCFWYVWSRFLCQYPCGYSLRVVVNSLYWTAISHQHLTSLIYLENKVTSIHTMLYSFQIGVLVLVWAIDSRTRTWNTALLATWNACLCRHKRRACNARFIGLRYINLSSPLLLTCNECLPYSFRSSVMLVRFLRFLRVVVFVIVWNCNECNVVALSWTQTDFLLSCNRWYQRFPEYISNAENQDSKPQGNVVNDHIDYGPKFGVGNQKFQKLLTNNTRNARKWRPMHEWKDGQIPESKDEGTGDKLFEMQSFEQRYGRVHCQATFSLYPRTTEWETRSNLLLLGTNGTIWFHTQCPSTEIDECVSNHIFSSRALLFEEPVSEQKDHRDHRTDSLWEPVWRGEGGQETDCTQSIRHLESTWWVTRQKLKKMLLATRDTVPLASMIQRTRWLAENWAID